MKYILILLTLCLALKANAQYPYDAKRDNVWINGYQTILPPYNFYNTLRFDNRADPQIDSIWSNSYVGGFREQSPAICDTTGNLLLFTNGREIRNQYFEVIADSLNGGYWANSQVFGNPIPQGTMILPFPNHPNQYYFIHSRICDTPFGIYLYIDDILTSIVDISLNNGRGQCILKNNLFLHHQFMDAGKISACRHANGRDWWIIIPEANTNGFAIMLLSPNGLEFINWQAIGDTTLTDIGQSCFSPDGTKYIHCSTVGGIFKSFLNILEFDRCAGTLSNPQQSIISDQNRVGELFYAGCAASSDSRYLYVGATGYILQYDLNATNIFTTIDTVAYWNHRVSIGNYQYFLQMQLAPNGKIYCTPSVDTTMSVIHNPNEQGIACNTAPYSIRLYAMNNAIPNYPNFRLGPVDGTVCDSLGIDNIVVATTPQKTMEDFLHV
ncbi:MAG: hypothetical protein RI894_1533, partial [Bacteroidota bacterium]